VAAVRQNVDIQSLLRHGNPPTVWLLKLMVSQPSITSEKEALRARNVRRAANSNGRQISPDDPSTGMLPRQIMHNCANPLRYTPNKDAGIRAVNLSKAPALPASNVLSPQSTGRPPEPR
jgi:hypothetical protein